jgi:Methyltransferase domain
MEVLKRISAADLAEVLKRIPTEDLAEMLAQRLSSLGGDPMHDIFYRHGFHLLRKHYYLPIPDDTDRLEAFWETQSAMVGVNTNDAMALDLMENVLAPYLAEFRGRFPTHGPADPLGQPEPRFHLINGSYMAVDSDMLYGLIRHFRPRRIVEVGIGNSTLVAIAACAANRAAGGPETALTSIDPYPRDAFRNGFPGITEIIVGRIQDVPLARFEELAANDILFIDSSHVLRSGNDVHFEYLEVLPRLRPGVLVHIHDVSLPRPYPKVYYDSHLYWNEQYLLQAFLAFNDRFEVLWPGNHMMLTYPERMRAAFPTIRTMRETYPSSEPTAFWMRSKSV